MLKSPKLRCPQSNFTTSYSMKVGAVSQKVPWPRELGEGQRAVGDEWLFEEGGPPRVSHNGAVGTSSSNKETSRQH